MHSGLYVLQKVTLMRDDAAYVTKYKTEELNTDFSLDQNEKKLVLSFVVRLLISLAQSLAILWKMESKQQTAYRYIC